MQPFWGVWVWVGIRVSFNHDPNDPAHQSPFHKALVILEEHDMTPERIRNVLDKVMIDLDDLSSTIELLESLGEVGEDSPIRVLGDEEIMLSELVDQFG